MRIASDLYGRWPVYADSMIECKGDRSLARIIHVTDQHHRMAQDCERERVDAAAWVISGEIQRFQACGKLGPVHKIACTVA